MSDVALIMCYNAAGELLLGKRKDNGKWTLPAGHLNEGEDPSEGARRELLEETGLKATSLSALKTVQTPNGLLYFFSAYVSGTPHSDNDPDQEVDGDDWKWVDVSDGLPKNFQKLAGPEDDKNIVRQLFEMQKSEEDLDKSVLNPKAGYTFTHHPGARLEDGYQHRVEAHAPDGSTVGHLNVLLDGRSQIHSTDVYVHPEHRRKGLASAMYHHAELKLGRTMIPSRDRTTDGKALWAGNKGLGSSRQFGAYSTAKSESDLPETETCSKCSKDATTRVIFAEGMGYQPACDDHVAGLKAQFEAKDDFCGLRPIKKSDLDSSGLDKEPLGFTCPHGLEVFLVNGEHIRDHQDSDYVQGGNPERYKWIPKGEIWVDNDTPKAEISFVIAHECVEAEHMKHGECYDKAHDEAKAHEDRKRHEDAAEMAKSETETLLQHPNPTERLMALRLDSVKPTDLQTASLDADSGVHNAAIEHPKFDHAAGMHLLEAALGADGNPPTIQQKAFLAHHDKVSQHHLEAARRLSDGRLDETLAAHPGMTSDIISAMYNDQKVDCSVRRDLLKHPNAPGDLLTDAVRTAALVPSPQTIALARLALVHPGMPQDQIAELIKTGSDVRAPQHIHDLAAFALSHARIPHRVITDLMLQGKFRTDPQHASLRAAAAMGPNATPEHIDQVLATSRPQPLAKSINPDHLSAIGKASDPEGAKLVDHTPDLTAHPAVNSAETEAFRNQVLKSPKMAVRKARSSIGQGVSKKTIFKAQVSGHPAPSNFMVKPYNEAITSNGRSHMRHPHQGWSELTNQSLFHAAGIGHLHQKVHVDEMNAGPGHEKEPMTVTHIEPNHTEVDKYGGRGYDDNAPPEAEKNKLDIRKIALLDALTNNQDRHSGNLMVSDTTGAPLAIDHSRNFGYIAPNRRSKTGKDTIGSYVKDTAIGQLEPLHKEFVSPAKPGEDWKTSRSNAIHKSMIDSIDRYTPAFEWFGENSPKIRQAFNDRLSQIKDPAVREHLARNFTARADWMDDRAKHGLENFGTTWHQDELPMFKPGEVTDEEENNPEVVARAKALAEQGRRPVVRKKSEIARAFQQFMKDRPSVQGTAVAA